MQRRVYREHRACYDLSMDKIAKKARTGAKSQVTSKRGRPVAKRVRADKAKPDFIGRLEGVFQIVGDIESPIEPEAWECCREDDLERINRAAKRLNGEATDVVEYQAAED